MKRATRIAAGGLIWASMLGSAWAVQFPQPGREDARVRYVPYESGNVTDVWTAPGAALTIQFSPTENVVSVAESDSAFLKVVPVQNYLFMKPTGILAPQPVAVLCRRANGTMRHYFFQVETVAGKLGVGSNVDYAVVFTYPHQTYEHDLAKQKAAEARAVRQAAKDRLLEAGDVMTAATVNQYHGPRNYEYTARGNKSLRPSEIWDNGYSTVMTFPAEQRIPSIFYIQPDGKEATANYSIHGNTVVVPGTAPEWRLRDGHTVLDMYDLNYNTIGATPGTHTISQAVAREVRKPHGN
ncbi:TrbG/VirB9 family P-type conjugative transfer protein [Acidiphilium iwatense]|uniref:TrbG/VirB9 family P-type conjugative transfer protein n=1 Tax=Acidiphilium iwatense TaxID=768198 RepID=A0ABS9DZR9_9PROT|nr:TrbG/VirB9 family P-type conjugative transfer protein [Acidiphilium iwatense]MCF3948257.1 TrbG/VirB9 family P-type conjugative transfer protein [Acidiphilium iwatense]